MKRLNNGIVHFFHKQGCVVVSTIDKEGFPHNACKGIVDINSRGRVYLLDLYMGTTYENLKKNPRISITAIDEHEFVGYCLKGKAEIIPESELKPNTIKAWELRISGRLTQRLLKNIRNEKGHSRHPEIFLPKPAYMIGMEVEEIVDLTPRHLKEGV